MLGTLLVKKNSATHKHTPKTKEHYYIHSHQLQNKINFNKKGAGNPRVKLVIHFSMKKIESLVFFVLFNDTLVSIRTFDVMCDHTFSKTCKSPDQTFGHT